MVSPTIFKFIFFSFPFIYFFGKRELFISYEIWCHSSFSLKKNNCMLVNQSQRVVPSSFLRHSGEENCIFSFSFRRLLLRDVMVLRLPIFPPSRSDAQPEKEEETPMIKRKNEEKVHFPGIESSVTKKGGYKLKFSQINIIPSISFSGVIVTLMSFSSSLPRT